MKVSLNNLSTSSEARIIGVLSGIYYHALKEVENTGPVKIWTKEEIAELNKQRINN